MADKELASITAATSIAGSDLLYAVIGSNSRKITVANFFTSPALVTPTLGVAIGTSLALGGATLGTNALAVTGTSLFGTTLTISAGGAITNTSFTADLSFRNGDFALDATRVLIWSAGGYKSGSTSFYAWAPAGAIGGVTDTNLSRNAAGVIQFGTTAANAAGSWLATNGTTNGGTLTADNGAAAVSIFVAKDNNSAVFTIADGGNITATGNLSVTGNIVPSSTAQLFWSGRTSLSSPSDGVLVIQNNAATDFGRIVFGLATSSFPAIKRSTTSLQARLADDSAFTAIQGKLTTDNAATTGLTAGVLAATTNATIVVYDSTGQAYRVPVII